MLLCVSAAPFSIAHPYYFRVAVALAAVSALVALLRRPAVGRLTKLLCGVGLLLLASAAGGLVWHRPAAREVIVMVDLSPSTRTATFRNRDALHARVRQLVGRTPYRLRAF